jgi:putative endonuclease
MFVYILASKSRVLYVGVTNDLARWVWESERNCGWFHAPIRIDRLVYYEASVDPAGAISREKQIKGWDDPSHALGVTRTPSALDSAF